LRRLAQQVAEVAVALIVFQQFMSQEVTEPGNIPLGGGVRRQHANGFPYRHVANLVMQQHHRLWTEQAGGIEDVIGFL
jgi:hypothetical protein